MKGVRLSARDGSDEDPVSSTILNPDCHLVCLQANRCISWQATRTHSRRRLLGMRTSQTVRFETQPIDSQHCYNQRRRRRRENESNHMGGFAINCNVSRDHLPRSTGNIENQRREIPAGRPGWTNSGIQVTGSRLFCDASAARPVWMVVSLARSFHL
jgi:hypothetical protein